MPTNYAGPYMRTPFIHLTGFGPGNLIQGGHCAKAELNLMECLEAYGLDKGIKYCRGYLEDFNECRFKVKQIARRDTMEYERNKRYYDKECDQLYLPTPPFNSR